MILASEHFVAFTGAGISTASGIPDYRSGANTILPTGPGCWETAANIAKAKKNGTLMKNPPKINFRTAIQKAYPSKCHMALVELMNKGFLKHIISQNIDGLHLKSGIPVD
jgi:NAD-dependent SIR2 family protein deacetylase